VTVWDGLILGEWSGLWAHESDGDEKMRKKSLVLDEGWSSCLKMKAERDSGTG